MVGGTLAFGLDEKFQPLEVGSFPGRKWLQQLQTLGIGGNLHFHPAAIAGRGLVAGIFHGETFGRSSNPSARPVSPARPCYW